jgi:hypothetical protein
MNATRLLLVLSVLVFCDQYLAGQQCEYWSEPDSLSDSMEDNRNPFLVRIPGGGDAFYVFWDRTLDVFGSEIVYTDYYNNGTPETVVLAEGYEVSSPQVISMWNWYPQTDTLAFIFYQTNQAGNADIYYTVMTTDGFTEPAPFANTAAEESHLRVNRSGGIVWQEGDMIWYTRLNKNSSGYFFEPASLIDEGNCMRPVIHQATYYELERFIAWEKGEQDSTQVWYILWNYQADDWDDPVLLFDDGAHSNLRSTSGYEYFGWNASMVSDWRDSVGNYHISTYDFDDQYELLSEFTQTIPFQPDLFTVDFITQNYLGFGYYSFRYDEQMGNYDIYSSDWADISPWFGSYCRLDSTATSEGHPMLFQAADHGWYFDLVCIWESFRNGHRQLFTSKTEVIIGSVPESENKHGLHIRAYPNPCSDQTFFEYELKSSGNCKLSIFNHLGQEIEVLPLGGQNAGKHQISWDAGKYPAGLYHFILSVDGQGDTGVGKIIVMH